MPVSTRIRKLTDSELSRSFANDSLNKIYEVIINHHEIAISSLSAMVHERIPNLPEMPEIFQIHSSRDVNGLYILEMYDGDLSLSNRDKGDLIYTIREKDHLDNTPLRRAIISLIVLSSDRRMIVSHINDDTMGFWLSIGLSKSQILKGKHHIDNGWLCLSSEESAN